jgi:hypothetical protein
MYSCLKTTTKISFLSKTESKMAIQVLLRELVSGRTGSIQGEGVEE